MRRTEGYRDNARRRVNRPVLGCILSSRKGISILSALAAMMIAGLIVVVVTQASSVFRYGAKIKNSSQNQTQMTTIRNWLISQSVDADADTFYEPLKEGGGNSLPAAAPFLVDPWNHSYRYCTWDLGGVNGNVAYSLNHVAPPVAGLIARVISAGADGTFATACPVAALLGDDSWSQVFNTDVVGGLPGNASGWKFDGTDTSQINPSGKVLITNGQITSAPVVNNDIVNKTYADNQILVASGTAGDCIKLGPAVPAIGDAYCGGFYAGKMRDGHGGVYALIVSPRATGDTIVGITPAINGIGYNVLDVQDGLKNTYVAHDSQNIMMSWARSLNIGGYTDWYIPARDELELLYRNLKPSVDANDTVLQNGLNDNSIPAGTAYTIANPTITTSVAFKAGGGENFDPFRGYWSSTEPSSNTAMFYVQNFTTGQQNFGNKVAPVGAARAVRRVKLAN